MKSYFDEVENITSWRKICVNNKGYLYYQEAKIKGKIIISTATFFGVIVLAIFTVLIIIVSLFVIAFRLHYKNRKKLSKRK